MVDKIEKLLRSLSANDRENIECMRQKLIKGDLENLDIKPLSKHPNLGRVRVGNFRFIFSGIKTGTIKLLQIRRRNEKTYKNL